MSNTCHGYLTVEGSHQNLFKLLTYFVNGYYGNGKMLDRERVEKENNHINEMKIFDLCSIYPVGKNKIIIQGDTSWEPHLETFAYLSNKLNLKITYIFAEPGCDFCGQAIIKPNKELKVERMNYFSKEFQQVLSNFKYMGFDYFKSPNFKINWFWNWISKLMKRLKTTL